MMRFTGLGSVRIFDKDKNLIGEGKMERLVYRDAAGQVWTVKVIEPKKCPHCGADM